MESQDFTDLSYARKQVEFLQNLHPHMMDFNVSNALAFYQDAVQDCCTRAMDALDRILSRAQDAAPENDPILNYAHNTAAVGKALLPSPGCVEADDPYEGGPRS